MNITERLIAWNMNMNDGKQTNTLLCDAVNEIESLTARLAAAEEAAQWLYRWVNDSEWTHFTPEDLTYLEQYPWLEGEAAKGGRDET